jgi:hypothetical protein
MVIIHRGAGGLVPIYGILIALMMNIVTTKCFGDSYYQEHTWPKLATLLLAGISCLTTGLLLKKKRLMDVEKEQAYIDSLSPKFQAVKEFAYSGPRDHLMLIPIQYWSIPYFGAAIILAIKSS